MSTTSTWTITRPSLYLYFLVIALAQWVQGTGFTVFPDSRSKPPLEAIWLSATLAVNGLGILLERGMVSAQRLLSWHSNSSRAH